MSVNCVFGRPVLTPKDLMLSTANTYEIHPQPDEPAACCHTKLRAWLQWLERDSRKLSPEDLVFPTLDVKGRVKLGHQYSPPRIQTLLDKFTKDAGIASAGKGRHTPSIVSVEVEPSIDICTLAKRSGHLRLLTGGVDGQMAMVQERSCGTCWMKLVVTQDMAICCPLFDATVLRGDHGPQSSTVLNQQSLASSLRLSSEMENKTTPSTLL